MKLIDQTLWIEFSDFLLAGWKEDTIKKANLRNGSKWQMMHNPDDKRMPLVKYESLIPAHKEKLQAKFNDPYEHLMVEPLKEAINGSYDTKAFDFFLEQGLEPDQCRKGAMAASVLNLIDRMMADKKAVKKLCGSLLDFFEYIKKIIVAEKIDLPASYKRLVSANDSALKMYRQHGYSSLIHGNKGKRNAAKINDEHSEKALFDLLRHENNYDDVMVCFVYNKWASDNGYEEIKPRTVTEKRKQWAERIAPTRYGLGHTNDVYIRQVKRLPASTMHPLVLVESDDYNINYYFKGQDGNPFNRYVSYIVADSATGLLLGKSYRVASAPVFDMVRLAYLDAMHYIRSLTGGWHLPFEVKADHWQQKKAHPFFQSIGKFVKPGLGNKHRGYIEQFFGSPHAKRCEKIPAHELRNYNGNNITAVNRGVNMEGIKLYEKQRPKVGDASDMQVEQFVWLMRNLPSFTRNNMEAPSREQDFIKRWQTMPEHLRRPISHKQMLLLFGFVHQPNGRGITITNRGIEPVIDGVKYSYDLPDYNNQVNLVDRAEVHVVYDPFDMTTVLVTDFKNIHFLANHTTYGSAALAYQVPGSRQALNMILNEKKELVQKLVQPSLEYVETIDPKALFLNGLQPKELTAQAETAMHEKALPISTEDGFDERTEWQRSKLDMSEYS